MTWGRVPEVVWVVAAVSVARWVAQRAFRSPATAARGSKFAGHRLNEAKVGLCMVILVGFLEIQIGS